MGIGESGGDSWILHSYYTLTTIILKVNIGELCAKIVNWRKEYTL